jgi:hypothetical protein
MGRRLCCTAAPLAVVFSLLVTTCGGSSSTSSSAGGSSSSAASSAGVIKPGGSFCDQARSFVTQLSQLAKSSLGTVPGATPNVNGYKQLFGAVTSVVDQLDSSAPGEIATAMHTLRAAYDQANTSVQNATTLQEMGIALQSINATPVQNAATQLTTYLTSTCGINPSASP